MDGLSAATSGMAVVSLALQLAGGLIKLYDFWGTVQDAPAEVSEMLMDLKLLSRILNELVNRKDPGTHVQDALEHCDGKVQLLLNIVGEFEPDFSKHSGRVRLWKAFKAARKEKKLKRFRDSLQETKTTLLLALVPQFQMPPAYVEIDQLQSNPSRSTEQETKKSPIVIEVEEVTDSDLPLFGETHRSAHDGERNENPEFLPDTKPNFRKMATEFSQAELQASLGSALQLAAETFTLMFQPHTLNKRDPSQLHKTMSKPTIIVEAD